MNSIECINFASPNAPNIVLIACVRNNTQDGFFMKHFKKTHNIYIIRHKLDNNFSFYHDLPSKHNLIEQELNKHNLNKFTISTISFGSFLAFYLIFYFPERVTKAIIHDFWIKTPNNSYGYFIKNLTIKNWKIPNKSNIPILFLLNRSGYVIEEDIKNMSSIFTNINYALFPSTHGVFYSFNFSKNILFYLFNNLSLKQFWNKIVISFIKTDNKIKNHTKLQLKIYILYLNLLIKRRNKKK